MFEINGLPDLRIVPWSRLKPGMIVVDGFTLNGYPPEEFRDFPVLGEGLIDAVHRKYRLRNDKPFRVLVPEGETLSPRESADALRGVVRRLTSFNGFRENVSRGYRDLGLRPGAALRSEAVWGDATFSPWPARPGGPSLLTRLDKPLGLGDVLVRTVASEYDFPADRPCRIHLVADYSYSMEAAGRDDFVRSALGLFFTYLKDILPAAEFFLYVFSDECRSVTYPIGGNEVRRGETAYDSFLRKVLRAADGDKPDVVLLFTDGLPSDRDVALQRLKTFPRRGIDFIQCVFDIEGDKRDVGSAPDEEVVDGYITGDADELRRLNDAEYADLLAKIKRDHSELAEAAGGMQAILKVDRALSVISVEAFDRWLGR